MLELGEKTLLNSHQPQPNMEVSKARRLGWLPQLEAITLDLVILEDSCLMSTLLRMLSITTL